MLTKLQESLRVIVKQAWGELSVIKLGRQYR
jgi:hypothetical protein